MLQGDHLCGKPRKPGNFTEFHRYQGNVRDFSKSQEMLGNCQGKILSGKIALQLSGRLSQQAFQRHSVSTLCQLFYGVYC